jgi:hypothetical protein
MTTMLLSVFAAASLVLGVAGSSETRSAQALPAEHLVVAPVHASPSAGAHGLSRLADTPADNAGDPKSGKRTCAGRGSQQTKDKFRCPPGIWNSPSTYIIGSGTVGGIIYAITSRDGSSSGQHSISN